MKELALHILDALQNSVEAGATWIRLTVEEHGATNLLRIHIEDNGRGMSAEAAARATHPFVTTRRTRHVGLGLPLFAEAARQTDGTFVVESSRGQGTRVTATFRHNHIDRAPLGDVPNAIVAVLLAPRRVGIFYEHVRDGRVFRFDSEEIRAELGDVCVSEPRVTAWVLEHLSEGEMELELDGPAPGAAAFPPATGRRNEEYERCPD